MPRKGQKQSRKRKASALAIPAEPAAIVTVPTPISAMTDDTSHDHEPDDPVDGDHVHGENDDDDDEAFYDQDASDQPPAKSRGKAKGEGYQVLPVAQLDDDWEGEAEDGATYLALALRENAKLPISTRVADPYRVASPPPIAQRLNGDQPEAGPSRHPALPRESWVVSFSAHFQNYRKSITSRWPPSPRPPYPADQPPFPTFEHRHEWIYYISGYSRRRISNLNKHKSKKAFSPSRPTQDDEQVEADSHPSLEKTAPAAMDPDDEEEWMNAPQPTSPEPLVHEPESSAEPEPEPEQLEEETARHRPRYPTFSILSHLSNSQIISILIQISLHLSRHIDHLSSLLTLSLTETPPPESRGPHPLPNRVPTKYPNPFPAHLTQWSFALLSVLDEHLLPDDLHHLREFARVVMRVGGWRWIRAVQDGEVGSRWALGQSRVNKTSGQVEGAADADESGVDETLTRCWMIVSAIAAGWAQHDLLESLETLFQ